MFNENEDIRGIEIEEEKSDSDYDSDVSIDCDFRADVYEKHTVQVKNKTRKERRDTNNYMKAFNHAWLTVKNPDTPVKPLKTGKINRSRYYNNFSYY
jgi:hypothetical protein